MNAVKSALKRCGDDLERLCGRGSSCGGESLTVVWYDDGMLTRGFLIGSIIDSFSEINEQVRMRSRLNLLDLNRYLEDFFKDILNIAFGYELKNANTERVNSPGIDLINDSRSIGFQITSQKTSQKIQETLTKVGALNQKPSKIIIFILGEKQNSYTIPQEMSEIVTPSFSESDIWDVYTLCKEIISLDLEKIKEIYDLIKSELRTIKSELEVSDEDGNFKTNIDQFVEKIPKLTIGEGAIYRQHLEAKYGNDDDHFSYPFAEIKKIIVKLKPLPRITREVLALVIEKSDYDTNPNVYRILDHKIKRICSYEGLQADLYMLGYEGILRHWESNDNNPHGYYWEYSDRDSILHELVEFLGKNGKTLSYVFKTFDFSVLG